MNKDNAKAFLPLVNALAEGKTIQMHAEGEDWVDLKDIAFAGSPDNYRVKPTGPREWWLVFHRDGCRRFYDTEEQAREVLAPGSYKVRVREVGL